LTTAEEGSVLRQALANLPRAENHSPGARVDPEKLVPVREHKAALDIERPIVVGNRGMGKSFWAHALADAGVRERLAASFPEVGRLTARFGFNASERADAIAPTPNELHDAVRADVDFDALWRAVLLRAALTEPSRPDAVPFADFTPLCGWVASHGAEVDRLLTRADDEHAAEGKRLVVVFDALERLAGDWTTTRLLTASLLKRALAALSYRALRLKLFMRSDQFEAPGLFEFPDGSKLRNTRVHLAWSSTDLYELLFKRLEQDEGGAETFTRLVARARRGGVLPRFPPEQKAIVDELTGEFMGAGAKRGRVFTWLPLHLADARGETSPRTFLTAWQVAARHTPAPAGKAVDRSGLLEGVRQASADRVRELEEDYGWISLALAPLRKQMVPMEQSMLESLWEQAGTVEQIREDSAKSGRPAPLQLYDPAISAHEALVRSLQIIGVVESRPNGKINVPDIFRVEAGIMRKGGVKPPRRPGTG
jgi:hypothetical protein